MKPELVRYRLERAEETLHETDVLIAAKMMNGTVNRLYYSMFYATSALLETGDWSSSKHSGVRSLFNQHYVKTGVVSSEIGDFFNRIYEVRHKGDYMDFVTFDKEQVEEDYRTCLRCVAEIRAKVYEIMGWNKEEKYMDANSLRN